jgi:hypothetical protein
VEELTKIFRFTCRKKGFRISEENLGIIRDYFKHCDELGKSSFGNARFVRNLFERTIQELSGRLASVENPANEELNTITGDDILHSVEGSRDQ